MNLEKSNVSLRQLEIFQAIVVAGSFSRATALTGLSQPTISQQLASLENELKVQLIIRGKKSSIELTPEGEYWIARASEIIGQMEAALTAHESLFLDQGLTINFGTTPSLQGRFDELISVAAVKIPQIRALNIHSFLNSKLVSEALTAHRINVGIASRQDLEQRKSSFHIVKLYDDKIVWAVPRSVPVQTILDVIRSGENIQGFACLDRYVTLGRIAPWHQRTSDWFRHNLPFAQPFFGSATHLSAVQIAASGCATCHTPATLIPNLAEGVRERLNFFDIGELAREVCLVFPKHLLNTKPFVEFTNDVENIISDQFMDLEKHGLSCEEPLGVLNDGD